MELVWDIEANNLLDHNSIDYTASPYVLKPDFKVHCMAFEDAHSDQTWEYDPSKLDQGYAMFDKVTTIIGHNIINYDLLVLKLKYGLDYEIDEFDSHNCYINGRQVRIIDTMVLSKVMNPDRYGGHSIEAWGERLGLEKIDWRAKAIELGLIPYNAPKGAEFAVYHPEMLVYNKRDVRVNKLVFHKLMEEWGDWKWEGPFSLEQKTQDIITRQSHRGFWFNKELADANVRDLDQKMEEIREIVEPLLPPKPMGKTALKNFLPPKIQFKKDGSVSAVMEKWVAKHNGDISESLTGISAFMYGKEWRLPMAQDVAVQTHEPATVKDITHIKSWLVELGWEPSSYKERDLTVDSKKVKLTREKYEAAVEKYVEQTLSSPFCKDRCFELDVSPKKLRDKLLKHDIKRPMKVLTNPTITVGQEKELDGKLLELADKFPHAKLVSEYLTYAHRRNSILGGGVDPDDVDEDDEFQGKGYMASDRINVDGRIPTPADSCGAATSRMKHRLVANIPRSTSLYGDRMRAMFGTNATDGVFQLGYDFSSLEAVCEGHYCYPYDDKEKTYCKSLTQPKPHDVHTVTAKKISEVIGQEFKRTPAKSVKYACAYGAQPRRVAKTIGCSEDIGALIHAAYWEAAKPLALLGEKLKEYWQKTGGKKFILGIDGRKVPTRSASALINSLFQSAGVIAAKWAMVIYERKLKEHKLYCDFFKDDYRNMEYVQQLIAYHDECQLEVTKGLVKWKLFKTEDEAKAFKKENAGWSEVGHSAKGYYVAKSIAGDLVLESVKEAGEYLKFRLPLGAEWIMGRNWAECH